MSKTILHVAAFPFPTHQGSQVYVEGMTSALRRKGYDAQVVCWNGALPGRTTEVPVHRGASVPGGNFLSSGLHWSRPLHDLALMWRVRRLIASGDVALLHAHNVEAPVVAWLASFGRVPVVYNLHTRMRDELPSYSRFPRPWMRAFGGWVDAIACRCAIAGVAPSASGEDVLRAGGLKKTVVATPGVDARQLEGGDAARARTRWQLGTRAWAVYAGNLDGYQDVDVLLEAMRLLPDAGLMIVTGSEVAPWRARGSALGLRSENLRWIETRDFGEVKDALSAATVAVLPRVSCAGFPIKLLNHMAVGLPTIATESAVDALPSVVRVPPRDAAALAQAIDSFVSGARDVASLRALAREAVRERYRWDVAIRPVTDLYESLKVLPDPGAVAG